MSTLKELYQQINNIVEEEVADGGTDGFVWGFT